MLINLRNALMTGKKSPLPSGARWVEYLESTGTQWIDTGLKLTQDDTIEAEIYDVDSIVYNNLFGAYSLPGANAGKNACYIARAPRRVLFAFGVGAVRITPSDAITVGKWYRFVLGPNEQSIFDIAADTYLLRNTDIQPYTFTTDDNCWIFNLATPFNATHAKPASMRCRTFRILRGGAPRIDLYPIAIGTTGYMLDLVSGGYLPYGNAGTDNFVIGPDIPSPV